MMDFLPPWLCFVLGKERVYCGFKVVFDCLQQPVLNKQLLYCLLDVAVGQVFILFIACIVNLYIKKKNNLIKNPFFHGQIFPELRQQFAVDEVVDL